MRLLVHMKLESDGIFGNGMSMPGGEDICIQTDSQGFPFLKGSTIKGIFREELINFLAWEKAAEEKNAEEKTAEEKAAEKKAAEEKAAETVRRLMGESGSDDLEAPGKLIFSNISLHPDVIKAVQEEEGLTPQEVTGMFTYLRTFTSLEEGLAREGSLRTARCIKKGLNFYGTCVCHDEDADLVKEVLRLIKWVGTMRSRGFGKVRVIGEEISR